MPANFPTRVTSVLTQLNAVTGGAVTFADRVVAVMNSFLGTNNPFGTAATRDTGTGDGDVPVLDSDGDIASAVLPAASTTRAGAVQIAASLTGAAAGSVPTAAQITAESARLQTLVERLNTSNIGLTDMTSASPFVTSVGGFIIASGASGPNANDTTIRFTDSESGVTTTITVRKNFQTETVVNNTFAVGGNRGPVVFDLLMLGKGVWAPNAYTDAELYIAYVGASGGTFNVSVGAGGADGRNGFAYFLELN